MASGPVHASGVTLSVIVPTYNERENVSALVPRLLEVLGATPAEVIVVDDDSPDGTGAAVTAMAAREGRIRLVSRLDKRGLAGAVFAGAAEARGTFVCVLDADLSHDPEDVPDMLALAQAGADVVIGSRYVAGAHFVDQPLVRRAMSMVLNGGTRLVLLLWRPRDVLTGYVLCRREVLTGMPTRFSARGFKFLAEVLATQRGLRVHEWPIVFRERRAGRSKASAREALELARLCVRLNIWRLAHALRRSAPPVPRGRDA